MKTTFNGYAVFDKNGTPCIGDGSALVYNGPRAAKRSAESWAECSPRCAPYTVRPVAIAAEETKAA